MDASDSETDANHCLDSHRDFEDFCEADIGQTIEGSRPGSSIIESECNGCRRSSINLQVLVTQVHKI